MRAGLCRLLVLVLVAAVIVPAPLAYASPPDPVWESGFFDDDDYDDVIVLITSSSFILEWLPASYLLHPPVTVEAILGAKEPSAPTATLDSTPARGPPPL